MDAPKHVTEAVTAALAAVAGESDDVKAAVASAAARGAAEAAVPAPTGGTVGALWIIFVSSLSAIVVATAVLGGVYMLVEHTGPPEALITVFTSTLTALVGLFVRSPTQE